MGLTAVPNGIVIDMWNSTVFNQSITADKDV
jgi:hypothetical protein